MGRSILCPHGICPKWKCEDCKKEYREKQKRDYQEHKEERRKRDKKYYRENRDQIRAQQKDYYNKNSDKIRNQQRESRKKHAETARKYNRKRRMKVLIHYGGDQPKCACCGETIIGFLTVDHIENNGAIHRRKLGKGRSIIDWIITHRYPKGFQILCYNCNCGRGHNNGICPHTEPTSIF